MDKLPSRIIMMILLVGMVSIHCYPIDMLGVKEKRSTTNSESTVIMSNTVKYLLLDITLNNGLFGLFSLAGDLTKEELYTPEVKLAIKS